jgi:hypothetical protein
MELLREQRPKAFAFSFSESCVDATHSTALHLTNPVHPDYNPANPGTGQIFRA